MAAPPHTVFGWTEAHLRAWVEANPERVNDYLPNDPDYGRRTPLYVAVAGFQSLSLTLWLLDEKGADVNRRNLGQETPLHEARSPDILTASFARGTDPNLVDCEGFSPLMRHAMYAPFEGPARILQDERVRATISMQDGGGNTALHFTCMYITYCNERQIFLKVHLLLRAGPNPLLMNKQKHTPVDCLRRWYPSHHATIALLEEFPDAKKDADKASLLIKGRRLVIVATSNAPPPSCLQGRVVRGQLLPRVALLLTDAQDEEGRKLRRMVAFLLGMEGGPEGEGVPRDVFRVVLDLLMPSWDPLRRGIVGDGGEVCSDFEAAVE